MDPNVLGTITRVLLLLSFCLGLFALVRAADRGFRAAVIAVLAGILIGIAGLLCGLGSEQLFIEAQHARSGPIHSDMPGFGIFLLGAMGVVYFSCIFVCAAIIAAIRSFRRKDQATAP
jgi:hypothetical protein